MSNDTCEFSGCTNLSRARKMCHPHYKQWHRGEELRPLGQRPTPEERFWSKVHKSEKCWEWDGGLAFGYGTMRYTQDGQSVRTPAHRFSYELNIGPIPPETDIDHICHNPSCVRPDHLRLATRKQNAENRDGAQSNSKSGVRGVFMDPRGRGSYVAAVGHHGKRLYVGRFKTLKEAEAAVIAKRNELFTHNEEDRRAA